MLTPHKIQEIIHEVTAKHTKPQYGLYPPQKKIINYTYREANRIEKNTDLNGVEKVQELTNLIEGLIQYLGETGKILRLDMERLLTYIYYPENEEVTLRDKDNLLLGYNTIRTNGWRQDYILNNRGPILNRLIAYKNILFSRHGTWDEYMQKAGFGMPEQMHRKYKEMLLDDMRHDIKYSSGHLLR